MKFRVTIRKMLAGLVAISVIVVLTLSFISFTLNAKQVRRQDYLTEIVMPLEVANWDIEAAVMLFIVRQNQIANAKTLGELAQLTDRQSLEQTFAKSFSKLQALSDQVPGAVREIPRLKAVYEEFLKKDAAFLKALHDGLTSENTLAGQLQTLDNLGETLQINAEAISGRVNLTALRKNFALRREIEQAEKTADVTPELTELLQGHFARTQKACYDLRVGVGALSTYGHQLLLVKDRDSITDIEANKITQAIGLVKMSLKLLQQDVTDSAELNALVQQIEFDFSSLESLLTGEDEYTVALQIGMLQSRWLREQENLKALSVSVKESVEAIMQSLNALQALTEQVREAIEVEVLQAKASSERIIGLVGICAVALMVGIGAFIARRISKPILTAVAFAHAVAQGDLNADIAVTRQDEIGILANALKAMKDRIRDVLKETDNLIHAVQAGQLTTRGNAAAFSGGWRDLVVDINNLIEAFLNPIQVTAAYIEQIARGALPEQITAEFKGDFNAIKDNLNGLVAGLQQVTQAANAIANGDMAVQVSKRSEEDILASAFQNMVETIRQVIHEIHQLVAAAVEGKLASRGDSRKFSGAYGKIVNGVNETLDAVIGPLTVAADYVARLSNGDIPEHITTAYKGDFNDIKNNLNRLLDSTQKVTTLAQEIANGNLRIQVTERSDRDELMRALQHMVRYLQEVASVTEKISNKELQVVVKPKSSQDVLNQSLRKMVATLQAMLREIQQSMNAVQQQNWLRTGQAELSNTIRGEQDVTTLARQVIAYLANYIQAQAGTLYLSEPQTGMLQLMGSYAYTARKGNRNRVKLGEGLIGQAALEKQNIRFTNVPPDYLTIASGLGETGSRTILVTPFLYEGQVQGVLELGTTGEFTKSQQEFLAQVLEPVAMAFHSAQTRQRMQELLAATQQQAEELRQQQDQLQTTNATLEAQADNLRESEQKLQQQQEELRQTNEELEQQTKALEHQQQVLQTQNQELEHAQRIVHEKARDLELSNKYKSEFLANMSHELRTPLNSLLILSKLLSENKDGNLTEKQVEFARTIYGAGADLLTLINDVLDLSKIEAGKMVANIETLHLKGLAQYIEQHFTHVATEKGVTLTVTLADGIPAAIQTDRQRVEQILKNLLSNALKFTNKGGTVTAAIARPDSGIDLTRSGLRPYQTVGIAVTDTGIGIPADKQQVIFEAFQQVDGTTSRKYGGTGLGLSIARELTKLIGGELQLVSTEGVGSTFTLYLPEALTPAAPTPPAARQEGREPQRNAPGLRANTASVKKSGDERSVKRIDAMWDDRHEPAAPSDKFLLIVEDDPKFAKILFDLAREKGFKGLLAGDGAAGLQLAYQYLPSAILLDVGLPEMDGWTVMQKLKSNPATRHIPVHFISAYDQPLDAMKMGAVGYLTKPVSPEQLQQAFQTLEHAIARTVKRVLVVEDDSVTRASMVELLQGEGVQIMTVGTGCEAVQQLRTEAFDCLVVDLGLKDMSGFDLLEQLKAEPALAQLPIIVYTGKDLTKEEELRLKQQAESIIIKGVKSPERLLDEVTLFLHRVEADLPAAQQKKLRAIHDKELALEGKTILVVDDDMRNVFALASVLEDKGVNLLIADNGKDALTLLANTPQINLLLLDMMMPEMDGYEVMQRIRAQPKFSRLPIIALTAKAMKGDRQRCLETGANDYLSKPADIDKLLSLLRVWLY